MLPKFTPPPFHHNLKESEIIYMKRYIWNHEAAGVSPLSCDARSRLRASASSPGEKNQEAGSLRGSLSAGYVSRMYNLWLWAWLLKNCKETKPLTMAPMSDNVWRGRRTCQLRALRWWFHRAGAGTPPDLRDRRRCSWRRLQSAFIPRIKKTKLLFGLFPPSLCVKSLLTWPQMLWKVHLNSW